MAYHTSVPYLIYFVSDLMGSKILDAQQPKILMAGLGALLVSTPMVPMWEDRVSGVIVSQDARISVPVLQDHK